jgi:hypothetical protein
MIKRTNTYSKSFGGALPPNVRTDGKQMHNQKGHGRNYLSSLSDCPAGIKARIVASARFFTRREKGDRNFWISTLSQ